MNKSKKVDNNIQTDKRMLWPDLIRILAIYFVVQVHTIQIPTNTYSATIVLYRLDVLGVPLFVLLSGALLLGKQESYLVFFRKRCLKVLLPWIVWTFLYMLYFFTVTNKQVKADFFTGSSSIFYSWVHFFFRTFMSSLWFLPMIFSIYLLTPLLRIMVKYASFFDNIYFLSLWFIFLSIMPYLVASPLFPVWEPNILFAPIQFSGYFLLGYFVIRKKVFRNISIPLIFLMSVTPFLLFLIPSNSSYLQKFAGGYLFPGTVISSILLFNFFFVISAAINDRMRPFIKKIIISFSGASFGVYLINEMFTNYFIKDLHKLSLLVHSEFLITIITFIILSLVIILMQKIPLIKYIVP